MTTQHCRFTICRYIGCIDKYKYSVCQLNSTNISTNIKTAVLSISDNLRVLISDIEWLTQYLNTIPILQLHVDCWACSYFCPIFLQLLNCQNQLRWTYYISTEAPDSDYNLTTFWLQSDYILTTFWLHTDYILTTF